MWTRDGERVMFASAKAADRKMGWKAADGTGEVERLSTSPNMQLPSSWYGQTLVVYTQRPDTGGDQEGGQEEELLIEEPFGQLYSEVSRDGRWIAYQSNESGQTEILRPFPNVDEGRSSRDGGFNPLMGTDRVPVVQ